MNIKSNNSKLLKPYQQKLNRNISKRNDYLHYADY